MTVYTALDIANYVISTQPKDDSLSEFDKYGERLTHLKLQKILYYIQGFSLAIHDKPVFKDDIQAWPHGPVVSEVYNKYRQHRCNPLPDANKKDTIQVDKEVKSIVKNVLDEVGQFSAWKLRNMTHEELPWKNAWERGGGQMSNQKISQEDMKAYFSSFLCGD